MNGADRATGRRPRTPSARVASELLNAAESVLVKDGLRGLTVRAVAAEAGVAPMSVYNQFGGKAGLLAALPLRGPARLEAAIEADEEADARASLRHCCLRYREFALANPQLYGHLVRRGCPRWARVSQGRKARRRLPWPVCPQRGAGGRGRRDRRAGRGRSGSADLVRVVETILRGLAFSPCQPAAG